MDLLVVLSTTTAYFASLAMMILDITDGNPVEMQTMAQRRGTFFDSSVFLIMFILGGRALEALAKAKVRVFRQISLLLLAEVDSRLFHLEDYQRDFSSRLFAPSNCFAHRQRYRP